MDVEVVNPGTVIDLTSITKGDSDIKKEDALNSNVFGHPQLLKRDPWVVKNS